MRRAKAIEAARTAVDAGRTLALPAGKRGGEEIAVDALYDPVRLADAFAYAAMQHAHQRRKATRVPYVTHLLAVASLVGEHGGGEEEMMAALLHDAVEDTGGQPIADEIARRFGPQVARLVEGCTDDASGGPKAPWIERKTNYLRHAAEEELGVLRISAADKLHNLRTILTELRDPAVGTTVFERFRAGRDGTAWYYRSLAAIFRAVADEEPDEGFRRLVGELERAVGELERMLGE
jgi:GTP pyrophosphokinase